MCCEERPAAEAGPDRARQTQPVSVIVLTYEHFSQLYSTLDTVAVQDYPDIELIISDDASGSFPREDIDSWAAAHVREGLRVSARQNRENMGTVAHANAAAKQARGQYIKFLSPGDGFFAPDSLRRLVSAAAAGGARVTTSCAMVCDGSFDRPCYRFPLAKYERFLTEATTEQLYTAVLAANILSAVGTLFRRDFFAGGGFDEGYRYLDDWPTWLEILGKGERICFYDAVTAFYMLGGVSSRAGTAFDAPLLRNDMIKCLEEKVLPQIGRLTWRQRQITMCRYYQLSRPDRLWTRPALLAVACGLEMKKRAKSLYIGLMGRLRRPKR